VTSAFRGVDHDFASTAPKERRHVRLPTLINGAGPAGLVLAIGLKNAKIPFEICERHRYDLQSMPRRTHVSMLSRYILKPLKDFLRAQTYQSILNDDIALSPLPPGAGDARKHDHSNHTESFMEMLRQHVPVHYGFKLEREGISSLESVITSNYITGQTVRTFQGSLLVGADGKFSAGNAPYWGEGRSFFANAQFKVRETFSLWAWPAITYASTVVVARKRYESHFNKFLDLNDGAISQLFGNTRLMLITNAVSLDQVLMQLWYSRLAISNQDYNAFFGLNIDERDIPRVKCKFDARVARELDCLRPLPPPFAEAYDVCKGRGVSQKWYLNSVRMRRSGLATDVFRGGASMPAVLIGDAGHAVPDFLSSGGINWAMMDAIDLCSMMVQRYDDDE